MTSDKGHQLDADDAQIILDLVQKLTGSASDNTSSRQEMILMNVSRRMQAVNSPTLMSYLQFITINEGELAQLISAVTIHTTSFFREMPHYRNLERDLLRLGARLSRRTYRLLSAACSTGEELYSFAFILETFRNQFPGFDYQLVGVDVDPVSISKAQSGVYKIPSLSVIPVRYHLFLSPGTSPGEYVIDPEIRKRVTFQVGNLLEKNDLQFERFDQVVCRNVLIYLNEQKVDKIIMHLMELMKSGGTLTLGHCETINGRAYNLVSLGNSSYRLPNDSDAEEVPTDRNLSVLVVDESAIVRLWLSNVGQKNGFRVHTEKTADGANGYLATKAPDIILLDPNLPDQNGLHWLTAHRKTGVTAPCILFTEGHMSPAPEMIEALSTIAQDYINKTMIGTDPKELIDRMEALVAAHRSRTAFDSRIPTIDEIKRSRGGVASQQLQIFRPDLILLGASTGGTDSLSQVLEQMPQNSPPVICVQHIPVEFARAFHERLSRVSGLKLGILHSGDTELLPGYVYMSIHGAHVGVKQINDKIFAYQSMMEKVSGHRPSVDFLFQSGAHLHEKRILACLLTGMGKDGAAGLLELKNVGSMTIAQDEASSVVWGMPGEAHRLGAVQFLGNIRDLRDVILRSIVAPDLKKKKSA